MAKEAPTVSELFKAAEISDREIEAAVDALLASFNLRLGNWAARFMSNAHELPSRGRMWMRNLGENQC